MDLGRGSSRSWADTPDEQASTTTAQTIYDSGYGNPAGDDGILAFTVDETKLYALVNHWGSYELISCPFESCQSQRRVLYSGPRWTIQPLEVNQLILVDGRLFWAVTVAEQDIQGVASCSTEGCALPAITRSSPQRGEDQQSELAGDSKYLYWVDSELGLVRLGRDAAALEPLRAFSEGVTAHKLAVGGDYVYFSDRADETIYRARKDGTSDAEVVAIENHLSALAADDDALYYTTNLLTGRIVECRLGDCASSSSRVVAEQRWPLQLEVQGHEVFWLTDLASAFTSRVMLKSCSLLDCAGPAERQEFSILPGTPYSDGGHNFAVNQRFVFWNEVYAGRGSGLRRLAR